MTLLQRRRNSVTEWRRFDVGSDAGYPGRPGPLIGPAPIAAGFAGSPPGAHRSVPVVHTLLPPFVPVASPVVTPAAPATPVLGVVPCPCLLRTVAYIWHLRLKFSPR